MNVENAIHRDRLDKALSQSYRSLAWGRRSREELITAFAGPRYGMDGIYARPEVYVNLIQIAVNAYQVSLSYNDPYFLVKSGSVENRPFAENFQTILNKYSRQIYLGDTIREIVRDAVFLVGIGKTHLADSPEVRDELDYRMDPGRPYFSRISFDNWVHDVSKSDIRQAQFFGDRFSMNLELARECPYFKKSVRHDLMASRRGLGDSNGSSVSLLTTDDTVDEIEDTVDLINVYLPREKQVSTFALRKDFSLESLPPLCTIDWDGPELGPYRFLSFTDVPDNIMPTSPAQALEPLAYLYNYLMRKIARRSKQQKEVIHYEGGEGEDVTRSMMAQDMQAIRVNHAKGINIMSYPGPNQALVSFTYGLQEIFKQAAGNIDAMVGLAPTADTLGQSQMIDQKVGVAIAGARAKVDRFVSDVGTDLGWLMFDDPQLSIEAEREVPGTSLTVDSSWGPPDEMNRPAGFDHFSIEVEAHSMEYKSPAQQLAEIQQSLQLFAPMIPLAQQMGYEFQFQEVVNDIAELQGSNRIKKWFRSAPPPPQDQAPQDSGVSMRPPGTGQYTRRNISEKTGGGQLQALMQQMPQDEPVGMNQ